MKDCWISGSIAVNNSVANRARISRCTILYFALGGNYFNIVILDALKEDEFAFFGLSFR